MLITQVIQAGIKWLLSLLIPGAGFIKAIMAIKDLIVFFVESAMMLIPAITEAILALAAGSVAGVAKAIEFGLAKLIGLVINLFAKLIGLGGLSKKVQAIFKKIRKRVDKAVGKLLKKARKAGRKLMRKLGIGKKKDEKVSENDINEANTFKPKTFKMKGASHNLFLNGSEIEMASKRGKLKNKLKDTLQFLQKKKETGEELEGGYNVNVVISGIKRLSDVTISWEQKYKAASKDKKASMKPEFVRIAGMVEDFGDNYELKELSYQAAESRFERLPQNGRWQGKPGNSGWLSSHEGVIAITGGTPVIFKNGHPNFTPWVKSEHNYTLPIALTGKDSEDQKNLFKFLVKRGDFETEQKARESISSKYRIHHHPNGRVLQLVPTILHEKVSHIGGAAKLRRS
ncbi:HNH endonuclease [Fluviicola sp.]|uniref:HNH endonuclease n=1 Tax=Fluviicola sp. TaxID=1917219 RepID=UPI003D26EB30